MAVAALFAGAPQGHPLQHGYVIVDHRGLTDDDTRAVIQQQPLPQPGRGMDIHSEDLGHTALQVFGQMHPAALPQPMCEAIGLDGLVALEEQERREKVRAGRIAVAHGGQISQGGGFNAGIGREGLAKNRLQALDAQRIVAQLAGQAVRQRVAEILVAEHGIADDFAHHAVVLHGAHRFLADLRPDFARLSRLRALPAQPGPHACAHYGHGPLRFP